MAKRKLTKLEKKETFAAYMYISPWIIGFILFGMGPIVASLVLSFMSWDIYNSPVFIGLDNYKRLFNDPLFYQSMKVTLVYSAFTIPLSLIFGLFLSLLLNMKLRGINFFRTLFYLPSVIAGVAVAMLWMWIFNTNFGLVNYILSLVGVEGPNWFRDPRWYLTVYIVMGLWGVGGNAIIFLAGLQNIPAQLYEAAKIDGATMFQQFKKVTLPLLTPTLFFLLMMGIIGSFQVFTNAYIINGRGGGGPDNAGLFYMLYLYQRAFQHLQMGYASALAWIGGLISMVLAIVIFKTQKMWVHYDGDVENKGGGR